MQFMIDIVSYECQLMDLTYSMHFIELFLWSRIDKGRRMGPQTTVRFVIKESGLNITHVLYRVYITIM